MKYLVITGLLLLHSHGAMAGSTADTTTSQLIETYQSQGAGPADALRGEQLWTTTFTGVEQPVERSCTTCHSAQLTNTGKHIRTGKSIQPLAPSANEKSLTDKKKIEKWLLRNCKWTLGRECTPQEKTDLLAFISQQ